MSMTPEETAQAFRNWCVQAGIVPVNNAVFEDRVRELLAAAAQAAREELTRKVLERNIKAALARSEVEQTKAMNESHANAYDSRSYWKRQWEHQIRRCDTLRGVVRRAVKNARQLAGRLGELELLERDRIALAAREDERAACAKVCEELDKWAYRFGGPGKRPHDCAAAIRARGKE